MRRTLNFLMMAFAIVLFAASCKPKEQKVYVLSVNDQHANIDNYPQFAALLDSLRAVHPDLILISAGDNRSGNPINDRFGKIGYPMVALMNAVHFDLSALGNHEFDSGIPALRDVIGWSEFPYICANVTFDDSLDMKVKPYVIIERNGLKMCFIGGIQLGMNGYPDFHPRFAKGVSFRPLTEVIPDYLYLKDECNGLFLVSHCGYEEDRETAEQFPQLDAIFGGHSHTRVAETQIVNGVMITQSENKVKFATLSTFTFNRKGKMIDKKEELLSVKNFSKKNDQIQTMVDEFNNNLVFSQVVAQNDEDITSYEALGCFMTDAIRVVSGAQLAFQNPGGVRFDSLAKGPVTLKSIFQLDPFDNDIVRYSLTGEEILRLIPCCFVTDSGPIYCSGCSYTYRVDDEGNLTDLEVTLDNGKPLDPAAKYDVVMNSYMASVFDYEHEDPGQAAFGTSNGMTLEYLEANPHMKYGNVSRVKELPSK